MTRPNNDYNIPPYPSTTSQLYNLFTENILSKLRSSFNRSQLFDRFAIVIFIVTIKPKP